MLSERAERLLLENLPVKIRLRRRVGLKVAGIDFSAYEEGNVLEVPLWLARLLEEAGVAELREEFPDVNELAKALWKEQHSPTLAPLDEDFYLKAALYLSMPARELTPIRERERLSAMINLQDLVEVRLQKIVEAARLGADAREYAGSMTVEERILHVSLNRLLERWRNVMLKLARGGLIE